MKKLKLWRNQDKSEPKVYEYTIVLTGTKISQYRESLDYLQDMVHTQMELHTLPWTEGLAAHNLTQIQEIKALFKNFEVREN